MPLIERNPKKKKAIKEPLIALDEPVLRRVVERAAARHEQVIREG